MKKKQKQNDLKQIMFEENIYRKQLQMSHGILGKDLTARYDTGKVKK